MIGSWAARVGLAIVVALAIGVSLAPATAFADGNDAGVRYAVIVHPDNPQQSFSREFVRDVFLASVRTWSNGEAIRVYQFPPRSAERTAFAKAVLNMTEDEEQAYWVDERVRSGTLPPRTRSSARSILTFVKRNSEAIGFVPESDAANENGVRIVYRFTAE